MTDVDRFTVATAAMLGALEPLQHAGFDVQHIVFGLCRALRLSGVAGADIEDALRHELMSSVGVTEVSALAQVSP